MAHLIIVTSKYIALTIGLAALLHLRIKPLWRKAAIAATFAIFITHLYVMFPLPNFGYDHQLFWSIGRDVWAGLDPYAQDRFAVHPFLNPPTILPLFALFAVLPLRVSLALWTVANVLLSLALPALALNALKLQAGLEHKEDTARAGPWELPRLTLAGLAICVSFSDDALMGFYVGQLNLLVAVTLLAALIAQGQNRPFWAGCWLYLASAKIGTMVPFLLLFLRKADRWTWVVLAALLFGSCALTVRLTEFPARLATLAERIDELARPGNVNDYSYEGPRSDSIIGFEALFYRLGMRDRARIRNAQYLALAGLGALVAYVVIASRLRRPAASSLVALYSSLFLYHRDYDMVILALPLVYSVCRARVESGSASRLFITCGLFVLAILYLNAFWLGHLAKASFNWEAWGHLVQATVLPYATWLILFSILILLAAEVRLGRQTVSSRP
jgi:hypothetical protein